jgi:hypothetical protein
MKDITEKMLSTIREGADKYKKKKVSDLIEEEISLEKDNFLTRAKILMEEAEKKSEEGSDRAIPITKTTPHFGDVRTSQEDSLVKTVGEQVVLKDDALLYYPEKNDLVLNGEIPSLNLTFQFRYNDPSGSGIYIYANGLQLTDENNRTVGKIRDAFVNWKQVLVQDGDLMDKLKKISEE